MNDQTDARDVGAANLGFARALVGELQAAGIATAFVCPGSRSAPLALAMVRREAKQRFDAGMPAEAAAGDIKLGVYASWSDAERILPNVMRCYQEFRNELDQPIDLPRMLAGMERLRGARADHTCL